MSEHLNGKNDVETSLTLESNEINLAFQSETLRTGTLESYNPLFHQNHLVIGIFLGLSI